jgi:hypothetical protein
MVDMIDRVFPQGEHLGQPAADLVRSITRSVASPSSPASVAAAIATG